MSIKPYFPQTLSSYFLLTFFHSIKDKETFTNLKSHRHLPEILNEFSKIFVFYSEKKGWDSKQFEVEWHNAITSGNYNFENEILVKYFEESLKNV